ncbi:MAG: U32 family peptidase [Bacilli bacterium]|nr:U32 family peptidase [Bacilli bacterium]
MMHELLVPAGDMECLKQAVHNGCDAVYLACKSFGARKFAKNFDNEEIIEAINFCHLYGVKVYVTMNTLIKNNEVDKFLEQVEFLHKNRVDALIMQDFGMICLVRETYPNLEIHASTQANISSKEICKLYYDLGVKRVVFSRELSIDEIDNIDIPIEKEAFIHGALCISYSGECLMSNMLGGRGGNRGECAGSCRLPYALKENDKIISKNKYLLSTKELNTSPNIDRLLNSTIYSFKIEGRMKSPLYVGFITRLYRNLIDKKEFDLKKETDKLKTIYNREFTLGRIFNANDIELMNPVSPNHIGLEIGKVLEVTKDKIKIKINPGNEIHQYDAIRFLNSNKGLIINYLYDKKNNLISSSTDICYIDNKIGLTEKDIVTKTGDYLLGKEFENIHERKINISITVKAKLNSNLIIEMSDGQNIVKAEEDVIEESINNPITEESIKKQLTKLGNTPFICISFNIDIDNNIFIQIKRLNDLRRELVDQLIGKRINYDNNYLKKEIKVTKTNYKSNKKTTCSVMTEEQLKACLELKVDRIYVNNIDLYKKYNNSNVYFYLPRCLYEIENNLQERSLVSDFACYNDYEVIGNYPLNVTNIYTAYYLSKIGINKLTLSVELTESEINDFVTKYKEKFGDLEFEVLVYGRIENMIVKGNILNLKINHKNYKLIDINNREFPVFFDGKNTHILNYENQKITKVSDKYNIRYDFYDEDFIKTKNILLK